MHGDAAGVGPAPKCRRSAFSEGTERNSLGVLRRSWSEFVAGGTETHKARSQAEDRVPQGDGYAPNRCPSNGGNRNGKTHTSRVRHTKTVSRMRGESSRLDCRSRTAECEKIHARAVAVDPESKTRMSVADRCESQSTVIAVFTEFSY